MADDTLTNITQLPEYLQTYQKGILDRAKGMSTDPLNMPAYNVAGLSNLQQAGIQQGQAGIGGYQPYLQAGTGAVSGGLQTYGQGVGTTMMGMPMIGASTGQFTGQGYQNFMDPYTNQVVDQSMQDIARAGQMQQNQASAQAVGAGAFGGSRQGLQSAEIGRNVLGEQARTAAGLRSQGYGQAMGQASQSFENQMGRLGSAGQAYGQLGQGLGSLASGLTGAGQAMAGLGQSAQQMGQSDTNQLMSLGSVEQDQRQKELDASRATQAQNLMQPYQQLGFYSDIFNSMPSAQMSMMQQPAANPYSQLAGLGLSAYGMYNYGQQRE
jgi:hypothetical protein